MNRTQISAIAAAVVAVVFLIGSAAYVYLVRAGDAFADCRGGVVAGQAAIGGPFTLVDETGRTVTDRDVIDRPTLIYFGYTFCPDVCPMDASRNADAVDLLAEGGYDVRPVFISVDPARDTPAVLAEWTDYMHPDMLGLTGSPEQVKAASQAYRTYYKLHPADEDGFYLVDHSVFTYLVLPEIGFVDFFNHDDTAEEIARRSACFIDAAG